MRVVLVITAEVCEMETNVRNFVASYTKSV